MLSMLEPWPRNRHAVGEQRARRPVSDTAGACGDARRLGRTKHKRYFVASHYWICQGIKRVYASLCSLGTMRSLAHQSLPTHAITERGIRRCGAAHARRGGIRLRSGDITAADRRE